MSKSQRKKPGSGGGGSNTIPAPTGLTAVRIDSSRVQLTWNSVPNATTYHIYRDGAIGWIIEDTKYVDVYATGQHAYQVAAVVNSTLGQKSSSVTVQ